MFLLKVWLMLFSLALIGIVVSYELAPPLWALTYVAPLPDGSLAEFVDVYRGLGDCWTAGEARESAGEAVGFSCDRWSRWSSLKVW